MHSPIGGSKADVFVHCDLFVTMAAAAPPEESTQDARDGTAAHEIGADLVREAAVARNHGFGRYDGRKAADGTPYTEEMFDAAKMYANNIAAVMRDTGVFVPQVEQMLAVPRVHPAAFGTADCWFVHKNRVHLWEFKYGHRWIDEVGNWQAAYYFAGILDKLGVNGLSDQDLILEFRLVQPRAYGGAGGPIRVWEIPASELRAQVNRLAMAAERQFLPEGKAKTGQHCRNCPGRLVCPAALQSGWSLYEVAQQVIPAMPDNFALGTQLALVRRAIERLEMLETGYSSQVEALVRRGDTVPGWTTEQAQGRATWPGSIEDTIALGRAYGVNLRKDAVLTPNQAIQAGMDENIVKALSTKPNRGVKVVEDSATKVKNVFNQE